VATKARKRLPSSQAPRRKAAIRGCMLLEDSLAQEAGCRRQAAALMNACPLGSWWFME